MATGRAVVIQAHGGVDKLSVVGDFAFPAPGEGEILIKVAGASVNPVDVYVRSGSIEAYQAKAFPLVR